MSSVQKIEGYTVGHLLKLANDNVVKKTSNSKVLDPEAEERIPKFDWQELKLGRVLGRGGYCVVNEITCITLSTTTAAPGGAKSHASHDGHDEHHFHNIVQNRGFMAANCLRGKGNDCRYAIKKIQEASFKDTTTFVNAAVDLAIEARFLAVIRHPNIIKMRATSSASPYSTDFFVVLDRLYDTLTQRLVKWKKQKPTGIRKAMDRGGKKDAALWLERVTVVYDLACALKFLHKMDVMYRDIKPDNIGFDIRGDVKIFDFGLAKEFDRNQADENGTYKFTGDTGSPRYMAAEVALHRPYNEKCDVYSLCMVFWHILELEAPFEKYTVKMFQTRVIEGGVRPVCDPKWPKEISDMMQAGWGDLSTRLSMENVCNVLGVEANKNKEEEFDVAFDASRKSDLSLRRGLQSVDA